MAWADNIDALLGGSPSDSPPGTPPASNEEAVGPSSGAGGTTPPSWHGRELYADELKDPGRRMRLFNRLHSEAGEGTREKKLQTLETFMNRGVSRGQSMDEVLDDLNYFPSRIKNQHLTPEQLNDYEGVLGEAQAGSNLAKYGTGNAGYDPKLKRWVGFNKGVMTVGSNDTRNDRIGIEGPDRGWSGQPDEPRLAITVRPGGREPSGSEPGAFPVGQTEGGKGTYGDRIDEILGGTGAKPPPPRGAPGERGGVYDTAASFNYHLFNLVGAAADAMGYPGEVSSKVYDWLQGQPPASWDSDRKATQMLMKGFEALGGSVHHDPNSPEGKTGAALFNGLATVMGVYGAAKGATSAGVDVTSGLGKKVAASIASAMEQYPATTILSEIGSAYGGVHGEEAGGGPGTAGGALGAVSGSVIGGMPVMAAQAVARGLGRLGMKGLDWAKGLVKPRAGAPSDVLMDTKMGLEQRLSDIDADIKAIAPQVRAGDKEALKQYGELRAEEQKLVPQANKIDKQLPEGTKITAPPMRPDWADPVRGTVYAENQVQGSLKQIENSTIKLVEKLDGVMADPKKTPEQVSSEVRKGIAQLEDEATKIESAHWQRVPLKQKVDPGGFHEDLQGQIKEWADDRVTAANVPWSFVKQLQDKVAPVEAPPAPAPRASGVLGPDGQPIMTTPPAAAPPKQPEPTIQEMLNLRRDIARARKTELRAEQRGEEPNRVLIANYAKMETLINKNMPHSPELDQAKAISTKYHELFTRSNLYDILATGKRGMDKVPNQDTVDYLMNKYTNEGQPGLKDLLTMTRDQQMWQRVPGQNDAYPFGGQHGKLREQVEKDAETFVRQNIRREIEEAGVTPENVEKVAAAAESKVPVLGKLHAELGDMHRSAKALSDEQATVQKSALAKYSQSDPDKAIDRIWNNDNPAKVARELSKTFRGDPDAQIGFRAGLMDKLVKGAGGDKLDPMKMKTILQTPKFNRLFTEAFGADGMGRLERMVEIAWRKQFGMIGKYSEKQMQQADFLARIFGAQYLGHALNVITGHHTIQGPAYAAKATQRWVRDNILRDWDPGRLLSEAIRDPNMERVLLSKLPTDPKELEVTTSQLRRYVAGINAAQQITRGYWNREGAAADQADQRQYAEPGMVPYAEGQKLKPGQKVVSEDEFYRSTRDRDALLYQTLTKAGNPAGLDALLARNAPSANVEDRRFITSPLNPFMKAATQFDPGGHGFMTGRRADELTRKNFEKGQRATEEEVINAGSALGRENPIIKVMENTRKRSTPPPEKRKEH